MEFLKAAGENGKILPEEYEELATSWLTLTKQQISPKTTARRLTSLRGFAKWAQMNPVLENYIAPTPARTTPHPLPEGEAGLERMVRAAKNPQQVALVTLGGYVGCRISESLATTLHDIDLKNKVISISSKDDYQRIVPLSPRAITLLQDSIIDAVTNPCYKLITYQDRFARQVVKNLGLRAGLTREVASRDLRATFAQLVLNQTNNIRIVQELLGRQNQDRISMRELRKAVDF